MSAARAADVVQVAPLAPGDVIGVAAPASPPDPAALAAGVDHLEGLGYRVRLAAGVDRRRGYLAGSDDERVRSLNELIDDPDVRGLLFARGGYGTARVIDRLAVESLRRRPRLVIGFSDLTVLLLALQAGGPYPVGYGPHLADLAVPSRFQARSLARMLARGPGGARFLLSRCRTLVPGRAQGILVGGCLTLLESSIGTWWQPDLRGAILFWEEWNEAPYRIDRMLQHLRSAGLLDGIRGMVVGRPVGIRAPRGRPSLSFEEVVRDHTDALGVPVVVGLAAGHAPRKLTLPLGVTAVLDTAAGLLTT